MLAESINNKDMANLFRYGEKIGLLNLWKHVRWERSGERD